MTISNRNYASNYSYMLASSAPLLSESILCKFLDDMDQDEYRILQKEVNDYAERSRDHAESVKLVKTISKIILAAGMLGLVLSSHYRSNASLFLLGSLGMVMGGVGWAFFSQAERSAIKKLQAELLSNRTLRLQDKIRQIATRLSEPRPENEAQQLYRAKDYFDQKRIEFVTRQTNRVTVEYAHR